MEELGWVGLPIRPDLTRFRGELESGVHAATGMTASTEGRRFGTTFGHRAGRAAHDKFRETAKYIIGPLIGAFAVEKVGELVKEAITGAAQLEKSQRRVGLVFGDSGELIDRFGEHAAKGYGLSDLAARNAAASYGLVAKAAGLNEREGAKFAVRYTKLGADLADFGGTDPAQAFTALQRGLAGATRGLKPYGVLIDSTAVKAEALADGIVRPVKDQAKIHAAQVSVLNDQIAYTKAVADHGKMSLEAQTAQARLGTAQDAFNKATEGSIPPLTQQQKILASSKLIWKDTTTQQGSFRDSQHGVIEQQRILNAEISNGKDQIGKGLLPIYADAVRAVDKDVVPALLRFSHWFEHKGGPALHDFVHKDLDPLVKSGLPALQDGLKGAKDLGEKLLPVAEGIFSSFAALPSWAQKAVLIGGGAAYLGRGALKSGLSRGLSGGAGAALGGLKGSTPADPVWVAVVNGGGVPGGGKIPGVPVVDPKTVTDPKTGLRVLRGADAEAAARTAAQDAFDAVKAAGGSTASASSAAGRAFKGALEARDAAVLREGLSAITGGAGKTLIGRILGGLGPEAFITAGDSGHENPHTATDSRGNTIDLTTRGAGGVQGQAAFLASIHKATRIASDDTDAYRAKLGEASQGFELMGRTGVHTFSSLQARADTYKHTLSSMPLSVRTELYLDTSKATLKLDRFRAAAGRHITTEQTIEIIGHGPSSSLDGVRRHP